MAVNASPSMHGKQMCIRTAKILHECYLYFPGLPGLYAGRERLSSSGTFDRRLFWVQPESNSEGAGLYTSLFAYAYTVLGV